MADFVSPTEHEEQRPACGGFAGDALRGSPPNSRETVASLLLEYLPNTVTAHPEPEGGPPRTFELAKCRCDGWFCPDCCQSKGHNLRARLIPILETFRGLLMVTVTVDPTLFPTPKDAYNYIRERRCIGRTMQDLYRAGFLHSRRYFYVVEFQQHTEQAHFHILLDASFIPFHALLASWSKHRPPSAGPVQGQRPPFGTVLFSKRDFADAAHAGRYATKYLIKTPVFDFPAWVMDMGNKDRVRRFSTSRGFWNTPAEPKQPPKKTRIINPRTYAQRRAECGSMINVFSLGEDLDEQSGEVINRRDWIGRLGVDASVLDRLPDEGDPRRRRRILTAPSLGSLLKRIEAAAGHHPTWINFNARRSAAGAARAAGADS